MRSVGKELGVRYVLEGSIRKSAQRIRVTGQLIDALTGNHLWAEKYDRVLEDIFEVQEELTRSIVATIAPHIDEAEREKVHRRRPESLGAYEHAVSALAKSWAGNFNADVGLRNEALAEAQAAIAIDPRSSLALQVVAWVQLQHVLLRYGRLTLPLRGKRASRPRRRRSRSTATTVRATHTRHSCSAFAPTSNAPPKICPTRDGPTN